MNAAQVLDHFDRISDAPDAVPRLRRFILDLAVWGKLVEQDPKTEQVASIYLNERRSNALPSNWRLFNFGKFCDIQGGNQPPKSQFVDEPRPGYVRLFQIRDLGENPVPIYISREATNRFCKEGEILIGRYGASVGKIFWAQDGAYNVALAKFIYSANAFVPQFAFLALKSNFFQAKLTGATRSAQAGFNKGDLAEIDFPLPPIAEQHRIVAKVDELMTLCDRLEAAHAERESRRDRVVAASLRRLNNGANADEFREHVGFHLRHLPLLATRPEHIQQLRQTILNLAVRGKLVPQDPNEEPASQLVERIEQKRIRLIAAKELRQSAPISNSISKRSEVLTPQSWAWAKCDQILFVTKLAGFEYTKHFNLRSEGEIPVVRAQNVRSWKIDQTHLVYIDKKTSEKLERCALTKACLLVTFIGAGIGDVALFDEKVRWHLAPNVAKVETYDGCDDLLLLKYLLLFLNSPFGRAEIFKHMKSTAQPSISMGTIRDIDIALPPLTEQHRIAAKVDELMSLCDRLETQLTTTQNESRRLLEAILNKAFSGSDGDNGII